MFAVKIYKIDLYNSREKPKYTRSLKPIEANYQTQSQNHGRSQQN